MVYKILTGCLTVIVVCVAVAKEDPKEDLNDDEGRSKILAALQLPVRQLEGYQKWQQLTPGPVDVTEGQFYLCLVGDSKARDKAQESQGIHWSPAIRVYANSIAKAAIDERKMAFPPGSVLVKEKLKNYKLHAITAMIREPDHAADTNNWRYFYIDKSPEMQYGRITSCRNCHQKAAETDFVFLKYSDRPGYSSGP